MTLSRNVEKTRPLNCSNHVIKKKQVFLFPLKYRIIQLNSIADLGGIFLLIAGTSRNVVFSLFLLSFNFSITVVPQYQKGIGSRTPADIKI